MSNYPCNFVYHKETQTLSWDPVSNAQEYEIVYRRTDGVDWNICYNGGIDTSCPFAQSPGSYALKGKTRKSGTWTVDYGKEEIVVVS